MPPNRGLCARGAESVYFESVPCHAETVLCGDLFEQRGDLFIAEFNQLTAFFADEVVVLGVAVVMFVDFTVVGTGDFADESGVFEFADGAIDSGAADAAAIAARLGEFCDDAVAVEVFVVSKDFADDGFAFLGEPFAARSEEFTEFLER